VFRTLLTAAVLVGALLVAAPARAADVTSPTASAAKACGSFSHTYRYRVSASGGLKCVSAMRIVKSFIRSHSSWREHTTDGTVAGTYYTNRKYKGWRCFEGSGGGSCSRGKRTAGYQN
jgi:hypothetical protein